MDEYFISTFYSMSFSDMLNMFTDLVALSILLFLLISFVSWAFWYMVRMFRHITR